MQKYIVLCLLFFSACQKKISTSQIPENKKPAEKQESISPPIEPRKNETAPLKAKMRVGAEQLELYLPEIQDKKVALVVNHSALVQG